MNPVCITAPNVNVALAEGLNMMKIRAKSEASRVGPVARLPVPLITTYTNPHERVLFSPRRNANPFFHFMEALWMLAGRDDLSWPLSFNRRFNEYSDGDGVIHGAYGYRWRSAFGMDQLDAIVKELSEHPESRRAVLTMWKPEWDLLDEAPGLRGKDVPCNTQAYFELRDGHLDMTVTCRSNDLIWGAYGANAVHFSMLLEYMAFRIGARIGVYRQFSNNAHVYVDPYPRASWDGLILDAQANNLYESGQLTYPLIRSNASTWQRELVRWMDEPQALVSYREPLFSEVAQPMYMAWITRDSIPSAAIVHAGNIAAEDWRIACTDWLNRRHEKARRTA